MSFRAVDAVFFAKKRGLELQCRVGYVVVEGTALLARLRCVLWSFAGDLVWDKRAGTGQHAQSQV